jgi:hypothetical protein
MPAVRNLPFRGDKKGGFWRRTLFPGGPSGSCNAELQNGEKVGVTLWAWQGASPAQSAFVVAATTVDVRFSDVPKLPATLNNVIAAAAI